MSQSFRPNWDQEFVNFGGMGGKIEGVNAKNIQSPQERLETKLYEAFEDLQSLDPSLPLDNAMRSTIVQFTAQTPGAVFKNAPALVLGCLLAAKNMNKTYYSKLLPLLEFYRQSDNIMPIDLVRYARYATMHGFEVSEQEPSEVESSVSNVWEWI